jgi:hypothetical protein
MIIVKVKTLADEVLRKSANIVILWRVCTYQAMKMMHALDIDDKATTMFGANLNVRISETTGNAFFIRDNTRSVCKPLVNVEQGREKNALTIHAQRLPCLIYFLGAILTKLVLLHKVSIKVCFFVLDRNVFEDRG